MVGLAEAETLRAIISIAISLNSYNKEERESGNWEVYNVVDLRIVKHILPIKFEWFQFKKQIQALVDIVPCGI